MTDVIFEPTTEDVQEYYRRMNELHDDRDVYPPDEWPTDEALRERLEGYSLPEVVDCRGIELVDEHDGDCIEVYFDPKGDDPKTALGNAWDVVVWGNGEVKDSWGFFEGIGNAAKKAVELAREGDVPLVSTTNVTNL